MEGNIHQVDGKELRHTSNEATAEYENVQLRMTERKKQEETENAHRTEQWGSRNCVCYCEVFCTYKHLQTCVNVKRKPT
jgi:hypothetical protein